MIGIIVAAVLGVTLMFTGLLTSKSEVVRIVGVICFGLLLAVTINDWTSVELSGSTTYFNDMLKSTTSNSWFNLLISACAFIYILLFNKPISKIGKNDAEYFALLLFIMVGVFMLSMYNHLLILFIGIEILSIPQYILAGSDKQNIKSNEASLKYFLMGAFSTGILLMGMTLIYGSVGSFYISEIVATFQGSVTALPMIGVMMLVVAFGFKVSAAPMHWWTADVYDGTPTAITPFMATIVKVAAFVGFINLFHSAFGKIDQTWQLSLAVIICATLLIGNITAVYQQSVKRMLAYSSIAQAGFMLFAVFAINEMADQSIIYYAVSYTLASFGIFAVLIKLKDYTYDGFKGLGKSQPLYALTATVSLLSLAGIPVTAGFFAKYYVLTAAIQQGLWLGIVVFAVLMAAVSVYYYFRVIRAMYFQKSETPLTFETNNFEKFLLVLNAILLILLGLFPQLILGAL
jgi:NADH-quinone oxidoreductase subunit N